MELKFGKPRPQKLAAPKRSHKSELSQANVTIKNDDNGAAGSVIAARLKVVVRKHELKHVMEFVMRMNGTKAAPLQQPLTRAVSTEERLILLWRKKFSKYGGGGTARDVIIGRVRAWRPALQSIPEEF